MSCAKPAKPNAPNTRTPDQPHPTTTRHPVKDRAGARFGDQQLTDYPGSRLSPFGPPAMPRDRPAKSLIEE